MRRLIAAALAATITFASVTPAEVKEIKPIIIDNDDGGVVDTFIMWYTRVRDSGVSVRVRGLCISACTIILWLPKDQVCIEPTASFGFHLFNINGYGPDPNGTDAYARRYYPAGIQEWLASQPALTPRVVFMSAAEAVESGAVLACDASPPVPSPLPPPASGE